VPDVNFEDFVRAERSALIWFLVTQHAATTHEAEEAAQMALVHAWRRWPTLTNPRAWVRTVAVREHLRSSPSGDPRRARQVELDELVQPRLTAVPSTAETVALSDQERLVCAELAKLPPAQRAVAALRYEGYSNREIAELLGVDQSAVRHNVLRARSRLRHLRALIQEDAG
jgi:RNA polymerase sigma factor (sigma-70 family)